MNTPDTYNPQSDSLSEVMEIIYEIAEKSACDDYIYRGEPEFFEKVSSSLYRDYEEELKHLDIEIVQKEILNEAKKYTQKTDEFEILTELQHYGGQTNLIDFTTDYLVALYFACDGSHDKDGRVILQKIRPLANLIEGTGNPRNRVIAQKSLFVRPPQGFLKPDDVINIPKQLKRSMLYHLRKYHGLSAETIYNDLHGFIKLREVHRRAKMEFYKGLAFHEKKDHDNAKYHYTNSIALNPNVAVCYNNRGNIFLSNGEYDNAIQDFSMAILLSPFDTPAYSGRGEAWLHLKEWNKARSDLISARERGVDIIASFHNDYKSVEEFEQKNGITLPQDLAAMLGG